MPQLVEKLIEALNLENYKVFDEYNDVWHENDFTFLG